MGDRLRIARFANWSKDYEMRNFDQLVGRNDGSAFGQLANTDYGNLYVKNFERRYAFMGEFNPLSYANVAYDHEQTSESTSCLTKLERHVLEEKRDRFAASAWTTKYLSSFPSLFYWCCHPRRFRNIPQTMRWWSPEYTRSNELRADGVHVPEGSEELIQPLRYRADVKEKELVDSLRKVKATKARTVLKPARNRSMRSIRTVVIAKQQKL
jgi:hypothetical protein